MSTTLGSVVQCNSHIALLTVNRAFIAGGIAACGAVTATHPFETVKIR